MLPRRKTSVRKIRAAYDRRRRVIKKAEIQAYDRVRYERDKPKRLAGMKRYRAENREAVSRVQRRWYHTVEGRAKALLKSAWHRAAKFGVSFEITEDFILEKLRTGTCERTGIIFEYGLPIEAWRSPWVPSLDRIDSDEGYTVSNVQLVCWMYNAAKTQFTDADVLKFCKAVIAKAEQ